MRRTAFELGVAAVQSCCTTPTSVVRPDHVTARALPARHGARVGTAGARARHARSSPACCSSCGTHLPRATRSDSYRLCATPGPRSSRSGSPHPPALSTRDWPAPESSFSIACLPPPSGRCCYAPASTPGTSWRRSVSCGWSSTPSHTWATPLTTRFSTCSTVTSGWPLIPLGWPGECRSARPRLQPDNLVAVRPVRAGVHRPLHDSAPRLLRTWRCARGARSMASFETDRHSRSGMTCTTGFDQRRRAGWRPGLSLRCC
jgi:hypothetical protein